jgi:hypothetical protein
MYLNLTFVFFLSSLLFTTMASKTLDFESQIPTPDQLSEHLSSPQTTQGLETLRLSVDKANLDTAKRLIESISALRTLEIIGNMPQSDLDAIWPAVIAHRDTLRSLSIRYAEWSSDQLTALSTSFPHLQSLGINLDLEEACWRLPAELQYTTAESGILPPHRTRALAEPKNPILPTLLQIPTLRRLSLYTWLDDDPTPFCGENESNAFDGSTSFPLINSIPAKALGVGTVREFLENRRKEGAENQEELDVNLYFHRNFWYDRYQPAPLQAMVRARQKKKVFLGDGLRMEFWPWESAKLEKL